MRCGERCGGPPPRGGSATHRQMLELVHKHRADEIGVIPSEGWDLDENGMCHIIVDSVNKTRGTLGDRAPGNALKAAMVRYFSTKVRRCPPSSL